MKHNSLVLRLTGFYSYIYAALRYAVLCYTGLYYATLDWVLLCYAVCYDTLD